MARVSHLAVLVGLAACGGGGGEHQSIASITIDGTDSASTWQSTGVDAAGNSSVVVGGDGWQVTVRFPGTAAGSFATGGGAGPEVLFTDANNNTWYASDAIAGSSYTITITTYDGESLDGSFTTTVVRPDGSTKTVSGSFTLFFAGVSGSQPWEGTYFGIFRVAGQVDMGTDPTTGETIWGPLQVASFRVTVKLEHLATAMGIGVYTIAHADISDSFFGCQLGCDLAQGAGVFNLPDPPGTPSQAGEGLVLNLPSGGTLVTANDAGELYTSQDARTVGNALGVVESWSGDDGQANFYEEARLGAVFPGLNPATSEATWTLTRSAL
jgi:hypothetical protein